MTGLDCLMGDVTVFDLTLVKKSLAALSPDWLRSVKALSDSISLNIEQKKESRNDEQHIKYFELD